MELLNLNSSRGEFQRVGDFLDPVKFDGPAWAAEGDGMGGSGARGVVDHGDGLVFNQAHDYSLIAFHQLGSFFFTRGL